MKGLSAGGTVSVFGTISKSYNLYGYAFVIVGVTSIIEAGIGISWTKYLGSKEEVVNS